MMSHIPAENLEGIHITIAYELGSEGATIFSAWSWVNGEARVAFRAPLDEPQGGSVQYVDEVVRPLEDLVKVGAVVKGSDVDFET